MSVVRPSLWVLLLAWLAPLHSISAAAPVLDGRITGIELASQSMVGAAVFVFEYEGLVDGKLREGWGWIAVNHGELPDVGEGPAAILGGVGEVFVGLRRFDIEVDGGWLALIDPGDPDVFDDVFGVQLSINICNRLGQCRAHSFNGVLSHEPLIPIIAGRLSPDGP